MKTPVVKTPLGMIALFVALIEAFLLYPVTALKGGERLILVLFMTLFPFYVASLFFLLLCWKPLRLYNPTDLPEELWDAYQDYQNKVTKAATLELAMQELEEENQRLRRRATPPEAAVLAPDASAELAEEVVRIGRSDMENLQAEVRARIESAETLKESAIEEAKREIQQSRRDSKRLKAQKVQAEMSKFRNWLSGRAFTNLPPVPTIVIEPSTYLNAHYSESQNTAHFGATISEDSDGIAHIYFHAVLNALGVLKKYEGDTAALAEGYSDYYACSYNEDPYFGEKFAAALVEHMGEGTASAPGISSRWIRNLEQAVTLNEAGPGPHHRSLVWSGGCWELRERMGKETVDTALHSTLRKLGSHSSISRAAHVLSEELVTAKGEQARADVREVFRKRGVSIPG